MNIYFLQFWRLKVWIQGSSTVGFLVKALFLVYRNKLRDKLNQESKTHTMKITKQCWNKLEDKNKWKDICVHGWEDLILLKCPYHLKLSKKKLKQSTISMLFPNSWWHFFTEIEKTSWNLCGTTKDSVVFRKWPKLETPYILISNYYKVIVMKNSGVGIKTDI